MVKAADPSVSTPVKDLKIETNFFLFSTTEHQKPFNPSESSIKCNISSQYIHSQTFKIFPAASPSKNEPEHKPDLSQSTASRNN